MKCAVNLTTTTNSSVEEKVITNEKCLPNERQNIGRNTEHGTKKSPKQSKSKHQRSDSGSANRQPEPKRTSRSRSCHHVEALKGFNSEQICVSFVVPDENRFFFKQINLFSSSRRVQC